MVSEISKVLRDRIETVLPNIFMQTLVPSFERACQEMFRQLASTYQKGMEESEMINHYNGLKHTQGSLVEKLYRIYGHSIKQKQCANRTLQLFVKYLGR